MNTTSSTVARLTNKHNILLVPSTLGASHPLRHFFGAILTVDELSTNSHCLAEKTLYLCGDPSSFERQLLDSARRVFVIREFSQGDLSSWEVIGLGRAPIDVHGVGVFYRHFFRSGVDHYRRICDGHSFQKLTESTKLGQAHRTGIYLTPVEQDVHGLHFRLLRCSTNFAGPTENFRSIDLQIVEELNHEANIIFCDHSSLNHVLAQLYRNTPAADSRKPTKAKISAHADKTKDMPVNGIMAFCTFYDRLDNLHSLAHDPFDLGYKIVSGLTKLHFRLKEPVAVRSDHSLPAEFVLTLYPNSVFFMPLSTNRLYTHEIRASMLEPERLPTRLGYVVRCSRTEAIHQQGQTYIQQGDQLIALEQPTAEGMSELRRLYAEENKTDAFIDYGDRFHFSMNSGDYLAPQL